MKFVNYFIKKFLILCFLLGNIVQANAQFAQTSVLRQGTWLKIGITQTGIYKIDASLLTQNGWNLNNLNPQHIHLFGNGGGMLPQANQYSRIDDLQENSIWVQGEADGRFDSNDFILFYAQSPHAWKPNFAQKRFDYQQNLYTDTAYYFLTFDQTPGLRIANQASMQGANQNIDVFDEYAVHEKDINNILKSGREWFGEQFSFQNEISLNFDISGYVVGSNVWVTSALMARDTKSNTFEILVGNEVIGNQTIGAVSGGTYDLKGIENIQTFGWKNNNLSASLPLKIRLNQAGNSVFAYLNRVILQYKRTLKPFNGFVQFRSWESLSQPISNFVISEASSNLMIWDISNPLKPQNQQFQLLGNQAVFGANTSALKEFVGFTENGTAKPATIRQLANQNLHSLATPNLLIICPAVFLAEANRLAEFRKNHDNLTVEVVTTEQVFNEFSSGKQDVSALRDFMRMLYKRNPNVLQYLLLFGDGSFDYKNRISSNTNFVPVYESFQSLHPIFSFSSDDYFGFLEDNEGTWLETSAGDHTLDVGIGRLPVKNLQEARNIVDKLIFYNTNPNTFGNWRNQIAFVADDGDGNTHQLHADELAEKIEKEAPLFNARKLFMDAFPQESTPSGELSPILKTKIDEAVNQGVLVLNFTGHGGESGWTEEKILDIPQIRNWRNLHNLPLFVTATCEFGRYDDPFQVSGAEEALLNSKGGAIGLLTTTRPVFASTNLIINRAFYNAIFQRNANGEMPRLGDIIKNTKNNSLNGSINRNFALLGDPSMRLAFPTEKIVITRINQLPLNPQNDTLRALQKITFSGEIQNNQQQLLQNFDGIVQVEIFDKRQTERTLGTAAPVMNYKVRNISLFKGQARVEGGKFEFTFVVPKDIQYHFGEAKIQFYAINQSKTTDAQGVLQNVLIGGSYPSAMADNTPPQINLWMDNEQFLSGGTVKQESILIARISDENGINISQAGIGHEITAILDNQTDKPFILNTYFIADLDTYKQGTIRFPLQNLSEGEHTITLKAWDTFNNSAIASIEFEVRKEKRIILTEVKNYPNPSQNQTTFIFSHDKFGKPLQVIIEIFDTQGKLIHLIEQEFGFSDSTITIPWNDLSNAARRGNGLFLYRITVNSPDDQSQGVATRKMIIVH